MPTRKATLRGKGKMTIKIIVEPVARDRDAQKILQDSIEEQRKLLRLKNIDEESLLQVVQV
ncbi:MAG: hypothetical protein K9I85_12430 [Saprospiraceae bacterium]|nr:hypothetical protein [Saprospiraceae bacterium]